MTTQEIIDDLGGPAAVGRMLHITSQAVSQWKKIPIERAIQLDRHPDCHLTAADIRPDVFGASTRYTIARSNGVQQ